MIYLCAGLCRSGSTWQYNAVRLILQKSSTPDLVSGWIAEKESLLSHQNVVIKIHSYDESLAAKADVILTSHRDLRDVAASLYRKFNVEFSLETMREKFRDYVLWAKVANHDLHYENLLTDRMRELKNTAAALGLSSAALAQLPYEKILQELEGEQFDESRSTSLGHDAVNLLHNGHITDGRHGSWKNCVPPEIVSAIEQEFADWMISKGYTGGRLDAQPARASLPG